MGRESDKGFSLVELLIVIAIMAVLSVTTITIVGTVSGWRLNRCAKSIDAALQESKVNAMSRGEGKMTISRDDAGDYYLQCNDGMQEKIADSNIVISYCKESEETEYLITVGSALEISFDAASGALKSMDGGSEYCKKLLLRMGERREVTIVLVKETGQHYLD